jgi:hypothetical protein
MMKALSCSGRTGMRSDPSVKTAAASSTTMTPPIVNQTRCRSWTF